MTLRAQAVQYGPDYLVDGSGHPLAGVACTISQANGATVPVWNGPERRGQMLNPVSTDRAGILTVWLDPGTYTVTPASGASPYTVVVAADSIGGPGGGTDTLAGLQDVANGAVTLPGPLTVGIDSATGLQLGTAPTQKFAILGATPVVQRSGYTRTYNTPARTIPAPTYAAPTQGNDALVAVTAAAVATTASTQTTPYGYASQAQADAIPVAINACEADIVEARAVIAELQSDLAAAVASLAQLAADVLAVTKVEVAVVTDIQTFGFAG